MTRKVDDLLSAWLSACHAEDWARADYRREPSQQALERLQARESLAKRAFAAWLVAQDRLLEEAKMDKVTVYMESVKVEFVGEKLAERTEYGEGRNDGITDTRGVTETLYRTEDDRLVVHVEDWSNWQGEPTITTLEEVTEADLQVNGRFEALGAEASFGRPLTLDEALGDSRR